MSDPLETRYRWLLRAYPKGYRRDRGAEMIGTLMEAAAADQRRPTPREAAALVRRGLQVRAGAHHPRSTGRSWLGALRLAVLLLLAYATAGSLAQTGWVVPRLIADRAIAYPAELLHPLATSVMALAVVAVAGGRYVLGLLATLGALVVALVVPSIDSALDIAIADPTIWPLPLAALLIAPLIPGRVPGTRRPLAWLLAVPLAVLVLPTAYEATIGVQPWATVAVTIGFLLWIAVDARATVAAGVALLPLVLAPLAGHAQGWLPEVLGSGWFWTPAIGAVALLAAGTVGVRRQADIYRAH